MSIFNISEKLSVLSDDLRAYVESSIEYYKLDTFKKVTNGGISLVNLLVVGSTFMIFLLFLSVAVAITIGESMESMSHGYYIVAAFYFIIFLLVVIIGKPIIRKALLKKYSKLFFRDSNQRDVLNDEFKNLH